MSKTREETKGDGSYDNPFQVNLFWVDDVSKEYYTVNTNVPFIWEGPNLAKPTQDNTVLVGASGGTTTWQDFYDLLPKDYGMIQ